MTDTDSVTEYADVAEAVVSSPDEAGIMQSEDDVRAIYTQVLDRIRSAD